MQLYNGNIKKRTRGDRKRRCVRKAIDLKKNNIHTLYSEGRRKESASVFQFCCFSLIQWDPSRERRCL